MRHTDLFVFLQLGRVMDLVGLPKMDLDDRTYPEARESPRLCQVPHDKTYKILPHDNVDILKNYAEPQLNDERQNLNGE
jgi:hypothetical protein